MLLRYPEIFVDSARIEAIASYIPRCISSMDAFLSGMEKQDSSLVIKKSAGKQYNPLLRFFDLNKPYVYYSFYTCHEKDFSHLRTRNRTGKTGVCHGFVLNSSYIS